MDTENRKEIIEALRQAEREELIESLRKFVLRVLENQSSADEEIKAMVTIASLLLLVE